MVVRIGRHNNQYQDLGLQHHVNVKCGRIQGGKGEDGYDGTGKGKKRQPGL